MTNSRDKGARHDNEIWKPVVGYEGLYEVSDFGKVKSLPNCRRNTELILKPYINTVNGYVYYHFSRHGKGESKRAHIVVMEAFTDYRSMGKKSAIGIDHLDGDKTNNALSNLEVVTNKENLQRAHRNGQIHYAGIKCIDLDSLVVYENCQSAARAIGGKRGEMVRRVCMGKRSHYRNHRFAYYDDFVNGSIPMFAGKNKRKASENLWR